MQKPSFSAFFRFLLIYSIPRKFRRILHHNLMYLLIMTIVPTNIDDNNNDNNDIIHSANVLMNISTNEKSPNFAAHSLLTFLLLVFCCINPLNKILRRSNYSPNEEIKIISRTRILKHRIIRYHFDGIKQQILLVYRSE